MLLQFIITARFMNSCLEMVFFIGSAVDRTTLSDARIIFQMLKIQSCGFPPWLLL